MRMQKGRAIGKQSDYNDDRLILTTQKDSVKAPWPIVSLTTASSGSSAKQKPLFPYGAGAFTAREAILILMESGDTRRDKNYLR